jgi:4-aminobutyrate aminotransferase-like enzyme
MKTTMCSKAKEIIASELLETYQGIEGIAINPSSWYNEIKDTAKVYDIPLDDAKEIHSLAYYLFINEI